MFAETPKIMRLSTATLTSARFTYVSPAGTLLRASTNNKWIRLVDGGYFENSGSTAIIEIINKINKIKDTNMKIQPIVIHISNEPGYPIRKNNGGKYQATFLSEVLSPIEAIFAVRGGKGQEARLSLKSLVEFYKSDVEQEIPVNYFHFNLMKPKNNVQLPLGWMLSSKARNNMDEQLLSKVNLINTIDKIIRNQLNLVD